MLATLAPLRPEAAAGEAAAGSHLAIFPAAAAFALAFLVARCFATVYECAIDTVFVCAIKDQADYGGAYMSEGLRDALGMDGQAAAARRAAARDAEGKKLARAEHPAAEEGLALL